MKGGATWLSSRAAEKAKDEAIINKIKTGEALTTGEYAYCLTNWSPVKQAVNLVRLASARKV